MLHKPGGYLLICYKAEKPSVCLYPHLLVKWIPTMAAWIDSKLDQDKSYAFIWHPHVYFEKFITILVCCPWYFESPGVGDFY